MQGSINTFTTEMKEKKKTCGCYWLFNEVLYVPHESISGVSFMFPSLKRVLHDSHGWKSLKC